MIAAWFVASLFIGAVLVVAASLLHRLERDAGRPVRWIWTLAIGLAVVLPAAAAARTDRTPPPAALRRAASGTMLVPLRAEPVEWTAAVWRGVRDGAISTIGLATAPVERLQRAALLLDPRVAAAAVALWLAASGGVAIAFLLSYHHVRRTGRRWPERELHGRTVRISESAGPAVVGISPMQIVLPRWILERDTTEQRLVLAHESQHVAARDPWLLAVGCAAVAVMPWNPFVWYALSRLRLAIELDCDRRVLRSGVTPRDYGALLLDLSSHPSSFGTTLPALAYSTSNLERRLLAMTQRPARFTAPRRVAGALVALSAILVACEAKLPTSAEVDELDGKSAMKLASGTDLRVARFFVDGKEVTSDSASRVSERTFASVDVRKADDGRAEMHIRTMAQGPSRMKVRTLNGDTMTLVASRLRVTDSTVSGSDDKAILVDSMVKSDVDVTARRPFMLRSRSVDSTVPVLELAPSRQPLRSKEAFTGLFIIDGKVTTPDAANRISPDRIASIEVLKGDAAQRLYSDPRAAQGVILISTKR